MPPAREITYSTTGRSQGNTMASPAVSLWRARQKSQATTMKITAATV